MNVEVFFHLIPLIEHQRLTKKQNNFVNSKQKRTKLPKR